MYRESDHELQVLDTLNKFGLELLASLDQDQLLDQIVERIREATRADLVILYPYDQEDFDLPPRLVGVLRNPQTPQPQTCSAQSIPALAVLRKEPLFLPESHELAAQLACQDSGREHPFRHREEIASVAAIPLQVSDEAVGVLFVNFRQPQAFSSAQKHLIGVLATFAALAIKNLRTSARLEREHGIIQGIDRSKLNEATNLKEVLQTILENANDLVQAKEAAILLVQNENRELLFASAIGPQADKVHKQTIPLAGEGKAGEGTGIMRWVFEHQETVRTGNVHQDPKWRHLFIGFRGNICSELDVPLIDKVGEEKKVIGIINLESSDEDAFSAEDQHFLETLAGQVVIAVKKAQAYEEAQREANRRRTLWDLNRAIIGELDRDLLLDQVLEEAIQHTGADAGGLNLYDPDRDQLTIHRLEGSHKNLKSGYVLTEGLVFRVARSYREKPYINCDLTDPEWAGQHLALAEGSRSELDVALYDQERLWGVLNVESRQHKHFGDNEVQLIRSLADLAVIALKNAERYRAVENGRGRMAAVHELSRKIIRQSDDPKDVMKAITRHALSLTSADLADLDLMIGHQLEPKYYLEGTREDQQQSETVEPKPPRQIEGGIVQWVAREKKPYRTGDAQNDQYFKGDSDIHSNLAVPMVGEENELVGVLNVESREPRAFDAEDQDLLKLFATVAVIAIEDARHQHRLLGLLKLGHELGELKDPKDLPKACELVTRKAAEEFRCLAVVRIHDRDAGYLVLVKAAEANGEIKHFEKPFPRIREDKGWNGKVFNSRQTEVWKKGDRAAELSDETISSMVITPIHLSREHYFGNLGLSIHRKKYFKKNDIVLIEGLAKQLAITYHRLMSIQEQNELKERNQQMELFSWIGHASFQLAHGLGNDLGSVRSWADLVREEVTRDGVHRPKIDGYLNIIVDDVQRVMDHSEKLRKTMGQFKGGEPAVVSVQDLWVGVSGTLREPRSTVQIVYEDSTGVAPVYAVKSHVLDILRNLISNSFEAMPEEGGGVTLSARDSDSDHFVEIRVMDTGVGIPQQHQRKIFNFQWSSKESSGFGLWSSQELARWSNGKLTVASEPGKGATFTLSLPRADKRVEAQHDES